MLANEGITEQGKIGFVPNPNKGEASEIHKGSEKDI